MIQVNIKTNTYRGTKVVDETETPRGVFESLGINYSSGMTSLDGIPLAAGEMDKTFADFRITDNCYLFNVVKADGASK